jgi:hypothetical protein
MAELPSWYEGAHDVCRLSGIFVPGVVTVDVKLVADIDKQKAAGKRKARSRDKGDKPHQVKIEITMTPDELADFQPLVAVLDPGRRNGVREAIYIEHPNTALWGITAIDIKSVDSPQPPPGGFWVVSVEAEEWTPDTAVKAVKKAKKKPVKPGEHDYVDEFLNAGKPPIGPPDLLEGLRTLPGPPSDSTAEDSIFGPPPPPPSFF